MSAQEGQDERPVVAVVDYRMGNLRSLKTSLERAGAGVRIITGPEGLEGADGLLLPGVGAFGPAMANLREQKLLGPVLEWARADRPFFAICVGMQLLFDESEEGGRHSGMGLVPGRVRRLPEGRKIPEMGWNTIELAPAASVSAYGRALTEGEHYYYAHSFCAHAGDDKCVLATTTYATEFASVVGKGRMIGTQFHPEKSAKVGFKLIKRFVSVCGEGA
jgi:glutamine amidotransferase